MPVVAVIGGVMSASAGLGAVAAAGGMAAMSMGSMIVAGLQIVGGVASALGAITGNEKLMKVGMIAGLGASAVSGLSSLASGSASSAGGIMDGAGAAAKGTTSTYADFASKTAGNSGQLLDNIGGAANNLTAGSVADIAGSVASNTPLIDPLAITAPQGPSSGMLGSAARVAADSNIAMTPATRASDFQVGAGFSEATSALKAPVGQVSNAGANLSNQQSANTSVFGKVLGFTKDNPELMKTGMGMLSGMGQAAQADSAAKRAAQLDADKRNRMNTSINAIRFQ